MNHQTGVTFCFLHWLCPNSAGTPTSAWSGTKPFAQAAACSCAVPDSLASTAAAALACRGAPREATAAAPACKGAPRKATAAGSWKDRQNMRLLGATSLTMWMWQSSLRGPPK